MDEIIEQEIRELREDVDRIQEMLEENTRMTRSLLNSYRLSSAISIIKWVIIIGFTLGAFYFIQPYLENILKLYGSINSLTGGVENNGGIDILKRLGK